MIFRYSSPKSKKMLFFSDLLKLWLLKNVKNLISKIKNTSISFFYMHNFKQYLDRDNSSLFYNLTNFII